MRRFLPILLLACAGLMLTSAPALAEEDDREVPPCTWQTARTLSVEELFTDFRELAGECVAVRALHVHSNYRSEVQLWDSHEALLAPEPIEHGLALNYNNDTHHAPHQPRWEEVLGRFDSCTLANEWLMAEMRANPDQILMLGGLCHYTINHFIDPLAWRDAVGPAPVRLRMAEVAPQLREFAPVLVEPTAQHAGRDTMQDLFEVLAADDFGAWLALTDQELAQTPEADLNEWQVRHLAELRQSYALTRATWLAVEFDPAAPLFHLLATEPEDAEDERNFGHALLCLLRPDAVVDDLPVARYDAGFLPGRPFICVATQNLVDRRNVSRRSATLLLNPFGFPETVN